MPIAATLRAFAEHIALSLSREADAFAFRSTGGGEGRRILKCGKDDIR